MNKAYRSVWNESTGTWVAVQETAQARGKKSSTRGACVALAALGMGSALVTSGAFAQTAGADASPAGSGVDTDNLASHYSYADFYTKVNGLGDTGKGSDQNGPSDQARSNGQGSVALGSNAVVEQAANAGIAVGVQAHTTASDAVALGAGSVANVANTVSVGSDGTTPLKAWDPGLNNGSGGWTTIASEANTRRVVNMAAGLNDNDAVNLSQLKSAGFDVDSAGAVANQAATYDAASIASGSPSVTLNPGAGNSQYYRNGNRQDGLLPKGTVIGNVADGVQDTDAANVGQVYTIMSEQAGGDGARMLRAGQPMMLGAGAGGSGVDDSTATVSYKTAAYYSQVNGLGNGAGSTPPSDMARTTYGLSGTGGGVPGAVAIGSYATTLGNHGVALGVQAYTSASDAVAIGAGSYANQANTVSVGSDGTGSFTIMNANGTTGTISNPANTRRVVNMAAGQADTDAVNVAQLRGVTGAIGGGAAVNTDGTVAAPTYQLSGRTYHNVGDALAGLDTTTQQLSTDAVKYDTSVHDKVTLSGSNGTKITNLSQGTLSATSTDAVNGAQLFATNQQVDQNTTSITNLQGDVANAVKYDTSAHDKITLGGGASGAKITNLSQGTLSATSTDAVNGAQLFATNQQVDQTRTDITNLYGEVTDSVKYDTSAHDKVTLGGGANGTKITNLSQGTLSATSTDAVNGAQLFATNQQVDQNTTSITNLQGDVANAVKYDTSAHDKITLGGGASGAKITNLAQGTLSATSTDAVNGAQLFATNQQVDQTRTDITNLYGEVTDSVKYDTSVHDKVTLSGSNGTKITNLSQGTLSTTSTDAVNGAQLFATNQQVDQNTTSITNLQGDVANAVKYDTSAHDKITLGGGASGAKITNLAQGTLSATSTDAVNGAQLFATNQQVDQTRTDITNLYGEVTDSVKYDTSAHDKITLGGGANGTKITNLSQGTLSATSTDAVNGAQLFATNQQVDQNTTSITNLQGDVANAVKYDTSAHDKVTLAGTSGTKITNLAAGEISATSTDALNGKQLYNTATSTASALGGGAAVNADGTIATPTFTVQGTTAHDVGTALGVIDAATTDNTTSITNLTKNINIGAVGLVQQDQNTRAITVASATDGATVNFAGTAGARQLNGVAAGLADTAAVNLAQLKSAGFTGDAAGTVQNAAATYDTGTIAAGNPGITLNPGTGNSPYFRNGDRAQGYLPKGTVIHNVANGVQDTDAASVGQVYDVVTQTTQFDGPALMYAGQPSRLGAETGGSGVNDSSATIAYKTAAYYSQVAGLANGTGSTPPSDMARVTNGLGGTGGGVAGAIAIGSYATTLGSNGVAAGAQSFASAADTVALGAGSVANQANTVSVGSDGTGSFTIMNPDGSTGTIKNQANTRRIVNMAAGQGDNDAVNVAQLKGVTGGLGGDAAVNADGSVTGPTYQLNGHTYHDVGAALSGLGADTQQLSADAVKYDTSAHDKITLGGGASGTKITNLARGDVSGTSTDAVTGAQLYETNQLITDMQGNVTDAVKYDTSAHDKVTLAGTSGTKITNLAAGEISATSTDALSGKQLYNTASGTASALGGGAAVNADGTIATPTFTVQGTTAHDVGTALGVIDAATTDNTTSITNLTKNINIGAVGLVQQDQNTRAITVASATDGATVNFAGTAGARQLNGVAAGLADTAAVNLAQLKSAGFTVDAAGTVQNAAATYDTGTIAAGNPGITLNPGTGNSPYFRNSDRTKGYLPKGTVIHNVANGTQDTDAASVGQVFDIVTQTSAGDGTSSVSMLRSSQPMLLGADNGGSGINEPKATIAYKTAAYYSQVAGLADSSGSTPPSDMARVTYNLGGTGGAASGAIAIGSYSTSLANNGVAVGVQSYTSATDAVALGAGSVANQANTVSVGSDGTGSFSIMNADGSTGTIKNQANTRRIVNMAAGQSDTDAVNVAQLKGVTSALGGGSAVNADGTLSKPGYVLGGSTYGDVGTALDAVADMARAGSVDAVVYDTSKHDKLTLGGSKASTPVELSNVANGTANNDAVNVAQLKAAGLNIDTDGNVTNAFVAYDDSTKKAITLGGVGTTGLVALHNVAPGTIGASSSDAVNGSQFYAGVASVAKDLGGNVKVNADGTLSTPNYVLSGNTYSDVGSALGMLDAKAGSGSPEGVVYDDTTHTSVTFGGLNAKTPVALHNVAAGVIGATSFDAVNGAQLYGVASSTAANFGGGATVKTDGTISAPSYVLGGSTYGDVGTALDAVADMARAGSVDAVVYDTSKHDKLTLGGSKSTTPVELSNVANGTANNDAVNVAQLKAAGLNIDTDGNVTNAFVAYDDSTKKSITLGGVGTTGLVTLHNVAAGVIGASSSDAVNGAQLYANAASVAKGMGGAAKVNADGTVSLPNYVLSSQTYSDVGSALDAINAKAETGSLNGVAYDDSAHTSVTFGGQNSKIPVALHNVAAGAVSATSTDATNGGQLYAVAQSVAKDLGGGSQVNSDGTISAPSYTVGGTTVNNVGAAITNLDGRVSTVENFVTNITGQVANAVQYDSSAHDKVTLGGDKGTKVTNLQDATLSASSTDAVTGRQLYATNQEVASLGQQIQNIGDTGSQYISTNTTSGPAAATGSNSIAAGGGATASGASSTAMGDKASATGNNSVAIGANSVADRDNSVSVGSAGQERQITNVADGKAATDAVNMRQFQQGMTSIQRAAFGGVAQATALTMIPDVDQGKTIAVGVGTANYKGYQAGALGASVRVTQNLKVKVGAGYSSGGGTAVGGGMSYQW